MIDKVYSTNPKTTHVKVKVAGMGIDAALRLFKRKVKDSGILEEYKARTEYLKPSLKKKTKRAAARKRNRIDEE
jgi:ribosomal protein S21